MASAPLFDSQGKRSGDVDLAEGVFGGDASVALVHQKVVAERNAARQGTSSTKGRSEVRGGGRKPYRQKGTGRARQGSIRAPHYTKGGVVFGPHPRDYTQKMPRKMRASAVRSALSMKASEGEVLVIEEFGLNRISTREAASILRSMEVAGKALVVLGESDEMVLKSFRNIAGVKVRSAREVSARDIVDGGRIVLVREALNKLEEAWAQ